MIYKGKASQLPEASVLIYELVLLAKKDPKLLVAMNRDLCHPRWLDYVDASINDIGTKDPEYYQLLMELAGLFSEVIYYLQQIMGKDARSFEELVSLDFKVFKRYFEQQLKKRNLDADPNISAHLIRLEELVPQIETHYHAYPAILRSSL